MSAVSTESVPARTVPSGSLWFLPSIALLFLVLAVELLVPAWRQSPVFDEGAHILGGYSYWTRADFSINPEHPPFVKLLATLPLLSMHLQYPPPPKQFFKFNEFVGGKQFVYANDANAIVFRARILPIVLTLLAALVLFFAAREMFGQIPALIALILFVFEPNVIAHGALVTTDMGATLLLFASVYAFYRCLKGPSFVRLAVVCAAVSLALAAKYSGILCFPMLALIGAAEVVPHKDSLIAEGGRMKHVMKLCGTLLVVALVAWLVLWAFYRFRFSATPHGEKMLPAFESYARDMQRPKLQAALMLADRHHLVPESYLYGFVDVIIAPKYVTPFLFGTVYPKGQWFYFPAIFVVKSTLAFLLLLLTIPIGALASKSNQWREFLFLAFPVILYGAAAFTSNFNHGIRHLLPVYPFLIVLIAAAVSQLYQQNRKWIYVIVPLLVLHAASSLWSFPNYIPYANELWEGPQNIGRVLSDSNVDWGQQLKDVKKYLDSHAIKDCWFDYFARSVADPNYYGIPCKPLPDSISASFGLPLPAVPPHIDGVVLLSQNETCGNLWGPGELNPYDQFSKRKPDEEIDDGILVFRGHFDLPLAAAAVHISNSTQLLDSGKLNEALAEAEAAVALAPKKPDSQIVLGDALRELNRKDESNAAYQRAISFALSSYPEFQGFWADIAKEKIAK